MSSSPIRILQEQKLSEQNIQNFSFDHDFDLLIVEIAGYDPVSDSIKRVVVDSDGHILVSNAPATSVWLYAESLTIANSALTTILSHTVVTSTLLLDQVIASGTVDAEYHLVVNGSTKAKYRTSEQDRTATFNFPVSQKLAVGTIIDIKVIHFNTAATGDFDTALIGHK